MLGVAHALKQSIILNGFPVSRGEGIFATPVRGDDADEGVVHCPGLEGSTGIVLGATECIEHLGAQY